LSVDDKSRNRGTGLCWTCFTTSPEARAAGVSQDALPKGEVSKLTKAPPGDVLHSAADFVLALGRWQVVHQTEGQITLQHLAGGSCLVAFFLFLLGVIPAMLYLLLAKGESRLVVRATPVEGATRVDINWFGTNWRRLASDFLETLPGLSEGELEETAETQAAAQAPAGSRPPTEALPDRERVYEQIRELGQLREQGLITEEEFTAKKADLLSRL
jgi:hypothetical protein